MRKFADKIRQETRGASAVEFALVLPIFALLMFAIIDFGWYFYTEHTLQFAVREGTRLALVGRILTGPDGTPMTRKDSIIKQIKDYASQAVNADDLLINFYPVSEDAGLVDPADWKTLQNPGDPGDFMRVKVRYNYQFLTPMIGAFFPDGAMVLESQTTFKNEYFDT